MREMIAARCVCILPPLVVLIGCAVTNADRAPLVGSSETVTARGEYTKIALDRVDGISVRDGKLVLRGSSAEMTVDLPASVDPAMPSRNWALVTESGSGATRTLTFTHEMSLDDFAIELPAGDAQVYYGGLSGRSGEDVVILAWGEESRSYWGYLTITRK